MKLTKEQLKQYEKQGVLIVPDFMSQAEVEILRNESRVLMEQDLPGRVFEEDKKTVRGLHGCHFNSDVFRNLTMHPKLLEPAQQVLGSDVYVHQFKINIKAAFGGEVWPWHQDYIFWEKGDGMPTPRAVNAAVFLDEVNEFNGPLLFIPGSQDHGMIDVDARTDASTENAWVANLSAKLKYTLDEETVASLSKEGGIIAPKGAAGSVLFFHGNVVHGSVSNISPFKRSLAIITYNSVENKLLDIKDPRPEFLASRDFSAIHPLGEDALFNVKSKDS